MTNWTETYRGTVPPWQCDVTEHFTIAYYFDRLEESEANLADELGLSDLSRRADLVRRMDVRFARELRKGASFHVESAALGVDTDGIRVGHRFVDSANGEVVTWFDERWDAALTSGQRGAVEARLAAWNGPAAEQRTEPAGTTGFIPSARGRVKPAMSMSPGISLSVRCCIDSPMRPVSLARRSAWIPSSCKSTGGVFQPLN